MPKNDILFYEYAACSTCQKAKKWLSAHKITPRVIPIVDSPPSASDLRAWITKSGLPIRKWLNTSGQSYRALTAELGKDKVAALSDAELIALLAADGKLIKRPVLVTGTHVLVGFSEPAYEAAGL